MRVLDEHSIIFWHIAGVPKWARQTPKAYKRQEFIAKGETQDDEKAAS